jgi:uncharacterized protein with NAD-binding domain and iron-sulfur cluster
MGSLAALFALTSQPNWHARFEITVLQLGFRLGGKCASGRNAKARHRNEEHGLHVLGGFYHNTFSLLRDCYAEWPKCSGSALDFNTTFFPQQEFVLCQRYGSIYKYILMPFEPNEKLPGVDPTQLTPLGMIKQLFQMLVDYNVGELIPDEVVVDPDGAVEIPWSKFFSVVADEIQKSTLGTLDSIQIDKLGNSLAVLAEAISSYKPAQRNWEFLQIFLLIELVLIVTKGVRTHHSPRI